MRAFYSVAALAIVLALGIAPGANAEPSGKLPVSVIGVRSDSGAGSCGLYSSPAGFREPGHELRGAGAQTKNGLAACVVNPRAARLGCEDKERVDGLCFQRASGWDLCGRGVPRGAQRDADGNRLVRQAE